MGAPRTSGVVPRTPAELNLVALHSTQTWRPLGPEALHQLAMSLRPPMVESAPPAIEVTRAYCPTLDLGGNTRIVTPPPAAEETTQVEDTWVELIARVERSRLSEAEASWSALESDGDTAVWDPADEHAMPSDMDEMLAQTRIDTLPTEDTARHHVEPVAISPELLEQVIASPILPELLEQVIEAPFVPAGPAAEHVAPSTTTEMAPPRAALLLQLAPTGFAGSGTPIDAAVVPRGRLLDVGRDCAGPWANDPYLDPLHARLVTDVDGVRLIDPGSRGGVWLRLDGSCWLRDGDWFRIGEQFFAYDGSEGVGGPCGSITLVDHELRFGEPIPLHDQTVIGRTGDVSLVHDPFVSAAHCRTRRMDDGVLLEDLDSSNGTWVRLRSGDAIPFGSVVAIGRSLYRVDPAELF